MFNVNDFLSTPLIPSSVAFSDRIEGKFGQNESILLSTLLAANKKLRIENSFSQSAPLPEIKTTFHQMQYIIRTALSL